MVRFQCSNCHKFFNLVPPSGNCPICKTPHMFLGQEVSLDKTDMQKEIESLRELAENKK